VSAETEREVLPEERQDDGGKTMQGLLWALIALFVALWIVAVVLKGFAFIGIHVLLLIAVVLLVVKLFSGNKS